MTERQDRTVAIRGSGDETTVEPLYALSLWQPWASLIAEGVKRIETRSWPAPESLIGERIAIHAAARVPTTADMGVLPPDFPWAEPIGRGVRYCAGLPLGVVLATATLVACVPTDDTEDPPDDCLYVSMGNSGLFRQVVIGDPSIGSNVKTFDHSDQLPYGDFSLGRWGWFLDEVEKLPEPIPAKGRQRLWRWTPPEPEPQSGKTEVDHG